MLLFIFLLTIVFPIAWVVSEFQSKRWVRVALGCAAISMAFGVAYVAGSLERLNSNAWFGYASKSLIDTTIEQLKAGHAPAVLKEMIRLQSKYEPTYENRARYDELIEEYVERLSSPNS